MKVVSALATVDFRVGAIVRDGNALLVSSKVGEGIPTQVYVRPQDALELLKAVCRSGSGLRFIVLFPSTGGGPGVSRSSSLTVPPMIPGTDSCAA